MPLEERPAPTAKNAVTDQAGMSHRTSGREQPVAGPSNTPQRQGFCSCCQVLYSSVEEHILSARHREVVRAARADVSSGSLMERFLQDVLQHHPHRYNDTRPTHADLPCLSTLPAPREVLSEVYCGSEDDGASVGTREEMPSSDEESCQLVQAEATTAFKGQSHYQAGTPFPGPMDSGAGTSALTGTETRGKGLEHPVPEKYSPTQGFLHRTSGRSARDKPHASLQVAQTIQPESSQTQPPVKPCSSKPLPLTQTGTPELQHRKAHRKTNRHRGGSDSSTGCRGSPVTKCITSKGQLGPSQPAFKETILWTAVQPGPHRERIFSEHSDQIEEVIEEVIGKYCYGHSPKQIQQEEEGSFHLSLQSINESKNSEEWDNTLQVAFEKNTADDKRLACLMEVHINLEDQGYKSQLHTALNTVLEDEQTEFGETKENKVEEIFPDLPHIPQSFVGKTWAQVMLEDDLKVDGMVKEFRQGQFRCYFDSESLAKFGKHCRKKKKSRHQEKNADGALCNDVIPLVEPHPEEDPEHPPVFKKTRRRIYRMASRCQVVKVSHGTQTTTPSCPVVRRKTVPEVDVFPNVPEPPKDLSPERTPDMKTRLCALKLPASYCKIMSPLQPKTIVYVLSSPDGVQGTLKPTPIKRMGRKRKSADEECAFKYKYKKTPLKYYDPLTNRILKTPPKGMSSMPSSKSLSHVRQLFRSLSPDINKERYSSAQRRSPRGSTKGRGDSSMADLCASTSGSFLDSGGPSEPGSSVSSSRRALFSRSSVSSSSRFLLGHLMPSASHTDSSTRTQSQSHADGSLKFAGTNLEEDHAEEQVDRPPVRRRSQRQGLKEKPLTPAKKPSAPPYRTKRKSIKARSRVKSGSPLQRRVSTRVAAGGRVSPRNKNSTRVSPRSSASSKLAL